MSVKIMTDSCSDLTPQLAQEFDITVVPFYVHFANETYRDNVDISTEEFYRRLAQGKIFPTTSFPSPKTFAELFTKLAKETSEILAIIVSQAFSSGYRAALQGRAMVTENCRIKVVDSQLGAGAQMLLAIFAAQIAREGANLGQIVDRVKKAIPRIHIQMTFDTLEYLRRGGRIGKVQAFWGNLLKVNPILTIKDRVAFPVARPRSRAKAIEHLVDFAKSFSRVEALAIEDATTPDELEILAQRLKDVAPPEHTYRSKVSPVVGTHVGPHVLAVSVLEAE